MESPVPTVGYARDARRLMRLCDRVTLGTLTLDERRAYVSLAAVATDVDGAPLLLMSMLSDHTKNLAADPNISMLFDGTAGYDNPQEGSRGTIMGRVGKVEGEDLARARRRYLARHPGAAMYADFGDFAFYRVAVERLHWVGGFGKAAWVSRPVPIEAGIAAAFAAAEPKLLERFARRGDRIAKRLKRSSGGWTLTALDPDGAVIAKGKKSLRLNFDETLASPDQLDAALSGRAVKSSA